MRGRNRCGDGLRVRRIDEKMKRGLEAVVGDDVVLQRSIGTADILNPCGAIGDRLCYAGRFCINLRAGSGAVGLFA
ncbi:hypothetical protein [Bradyrhizobium sp. USDA 4529]